MLSLEKLTLLSMVSILDVRAVLDVRWAQAALEADATDRSCSHPGKQERICILSKQL